MNVVKLMIGTSPFVMRDMLKGKFNRLVWASDNLETVEHYYEGAVAEIEVRLLKSKQHQYIRDYTKLSLYRNGYNWGYTEMKHPPGALWYSFSREYLRKYLIGVREIHPDLSQ